MKKRYLSCLLSIIAITLMGVTLSAQAMAASETLEFETHGLDLDTGTVVENDPSQVIEPNGADFFVAYNADFIPHAVLVLASEQVDMAFLNNVALTDITLDSIIGLTFPAHSMDQPLKQNDTVIVRTDTGNIFKLGNAIESETSVTINYEQLQ